MTEMIKQNLPLYIAAVALYVIAVIAVAVILHPVAALALAVVVPFLVALN